MTKATMKGKAAKGKAKTKAPAKRTRKPKVAKKETVLVLRTCKAGGATDYAFTWPASGPVEAPDWSPAKSCGRGLHGLLFGEGSPGVWYGKLYLVVEVAKADLVDLGDKVKFRRGNVVFSGDRPGAMEYLRTHDPFYSTRKVYEGIATAGDGGTATAGDGGTATAGVRGTATAGVRGTATAGYGGTATAGVRGTATAGDGGTATAGDGGTATAGYGGTATAGYGGTATAGYGGTATAGENGALIWTWYDGRAYRLAVAMVGKDGIKPNTKYRCNDKGQPEEVK